MIAERYRDQIKAHVADWLDGKISEVRAFASILAESANAELYGKETTGRIVRMMDAYKDFTDIIIVDEEGKVINSRESGAAYKRVSVADREYFREAMTDPIGITGFFSGRNTGRKVMTVARRFQSVEGRTYVTGRVHHHRTLFGRHRRAQQGRARKRLPGGRGSEAHTWKNGGIRCERRERES